ncbi:MAG: hypothetical protein JWM33_3441 [Caulobacteraceae bacterium]|nr:hypothetical protein [Caulobacteraceae bacterium]
MIYYSEFDGDGWEMRRVDILRDGRRMFSDLEEGEGTYLSDQPIPPPDQFPPEFAATLISAEEFEVVWAHRREPGPAPF